MHFEKLKQEEERFLISTIFHHNLSTEDNFDEDKQCVGTFIKWSLNSISTSESIESLFTSSNDILVDIFWSDIQIGRGTIKTGISKEIRQDVVVTHVFEANRKKVLDNADGEIPVLIQVQEGKTVSWPTREVQLGTNERIQLKKRKLNSGKAKADKKREDKRVKMTTYDARITACNCRDKCGDKVDEKTRVAIREEYWNLPQTGSEQNSFLSNFIARIPKKSHRTGASDRKKFTMKYSPPVCLPAISETDKIGVCLQMFLKVFGITEKKARTVLKKKYEQRPMGHGGVGKPSNRGTVLSDDTKKKVLNHLNRFPTVPSHYRRKETNKRYFESDMTIATMYRLFKEEHPEVKIHLTTYSKIVKTLNIGFYKPKNDQCSLCTSYKNTKKTDDDVRLVNEHEDRKNMCRQAKDKDKARAKNDSKFTAFIIDLEAVQNCPKAKTGEFYYVSKISCYNLSVYDLKSDGKLCYLWDQTKGARGSDEIGSCILNTLRNVEQGIEEVVIWADTCTGQNRNKENSAAVLHFLNEEQGHSVAKVHFKYFERGHNQSEVDTIHQLIEKATKNQEVYIPSRYGELVRSSCSRNPIKTLKLATVDYPVYDLHKLCEETILNRNRYRVMDEQRGKWKVQEASWMTSKRLSFTRGSRVISFSEMPDPSMNQKDKAVPTDRKVCTSVRFFLIVSCCTV